MNFTKYCAYTAYHLGSSLPPIMFPVDFIQPGGLHGDAKNWRFGFVERACLRMGRIYFLSLAMLNWARLGSVWPDGISSYEYQGSPVKSDVPMQMRIRFIPPPSLG